MNGGEKVKKGKKMLGFVMSLVLLLNLITINVQASTESNENFKATAIGNVNIISTTNITVGDIKAKARRIKAQDPNLSLIVIDYLTLISGMSRYSGQRQQEVSEISRALKALALELQIPILALAQLSRALEAREDKRPILSDLRESGQIEQDADIVAFLYRDDYHNKEAITPDNISKIEVIIRKNRNGSIGTAELLFKKNTQSFMNFSNDYKEVGD